MILPDFKRFLALAAPGGDADGGFARHLNPFNRKRKPPVAYWSGIVDVGPDGRDFTYTVPDYFNGKLRIVAIARQPRDASASTEAATEVKGDFILTPNVPATIIARRRVHRQRRRLQQHDWRQRLRSRLAAADRRTVACRR